VIAISSDDPETNAKFKASLKAPFHFIGDLKVVETFDVKVPLLPFSKRVTFVIGPGRKILSIETGSDAISPSGAVTAVCSLKAPDSLKFVTDQDSKK
jgi:thioredoxin-dependent peroxiredoxin